MRFQFEIVLKSIKKKSFEDVLRYQSLLVSKDPWGQRRKRGATTWAAIAGGAKRQKLRGMLAKGLQSWSIPIR